MFLKTGEKACSENLRQTKSLLMQYSVYFCTGMSRTYIAEVAYGKVNMQEKQIVKNKQNKIKTALQKCGALLKTIPARQYCGNPFWPVNCYGAHLPCVH